MPLVLNRIKLLGTLSVDQPPPGPVPPPSTEVEMLLVAGGGGGAGFGANVGGGGGGAGGLFAVSFEPAGGVEYTITIGRGGVRRF